MDHFYAHDFILRGYRYAEGFSSPLKIYGNSEVAAVFAECTRREMKPAVAPNVQMHEIKPYSQFEVGGYSVLTLPANHGSAEQAMLFYVSKGGKGYLHMHDTSVPEDGIYSYLKENGAKADLVSFDCTYADRTGIARPRHMNIEDCMAVKQKLVEEGVCGEKTKYVITHFSHNSNPVVERLVELESKYSVIAAYDGMSTITRHRIKVCGYCFRAGLIWQGLTHDLSKYSPSEFIAGARFYQGNMSPQVKERVVLGYSAAWLHHKGRNKHHFEYWRDVDKTGKNAPVKMPAKYFGEMICDRVAACRIYLGKNYTQRSALEYFERRTDVGYMHPETASELKRFLTLIAEKGEKAAFAELKSYIKTESKKEKAEVKQKIRLYNKSEI